MMETQRPHRRRTRPDVAGIISGTVLTGGAAIWMLNQYDAVQTDDVGLTAALLLVVSGIVGLVASNRG
jgi:hypothetical protein